MYHIYIRIQWAEFARCIYVVVLGTARPKASMHKKDCLTVVFSPDMCSIQFDIKSPQKEIYDACNASQSVKR